MPSHSDRQLVRHGCDRQVRGRHDGSWQLHTPAGSSVRSVGSSRVRCKRRADASCCSANLASASQPRRPEIQEATCRSHCAFACTLQSKNPRALGSNLPPECPLPIDLCPGVEALQRPDNQGLICAGGKTVCLNALPLSGVPSPQLPAEHLQLERSRGRTCLRICMASD